VIEPESMPAIPAPAEIAPAPTPETAERPLREEIPPLRGSGPASAKPAVKPEAKPEPVIPLIHVPDDPGPEVVEESETPV
jgi:hypothetical protein